MADVLNELLTPWFLGLILLVFLVVFGTALFVFPPEFTKR